MGLIYWMINVLIPIVLLIHSSISHFKQLKIIPYGKWVAMILILYLMNWISWIFQESYIVYFIDLVIKILVTFFPLKINNQIETKLSNFHLEIWLNYVRLWFINSICSYYIKFTSYLLSKMQVKQSQKITNILIDQLKKISNKRTPTFGLSLQQTMNDSINKSGKQSNLQRQRHMKKEQGYFKGNLQILQSKLKQYPFQKQQEYKQRAIKEPLIKIPYQQLQFKKALGLIQQVEYDESIHFQSSKKSYEQGRDLLRQDLINRSNIIQSQQFDNTNKDEIFSHERILECKVEVILEIGTGTTTRLQIYNIQLYSNRNLRILSLYQREFQNHKLHSMRPLPNGYYQLVFENGKIHSRKCKFRGGNFHPFLKYLK